MSEGEKRRIHLKWAWVAATSGSFLLAAMMFAQGKASDCRPGQSDGQCGLSTFVGLLDGVLTIIAVNVVMGIVSIVLTFWWGRHPVMDQAVNVESKAKEPSSH